MRVREDVTAVTLGTGKITIPTMGSHHDAHHDENTRDDSDSRVKVKEDEEPSEEQRERGLEQNKEDADDLRDAPFVKLLTQYRRSRAISGGIPRHPVLEPLLDYDPERCGRETGDEGREPENIQRHELATSVGSLATADAV